ncbi:putative membrane protein YhaJ [Pullulanibacillus camelliae]|uniref:Putative membrane protein YhaJ n=1 Tax=Pullulanibacillus camelliae TaxID=1707096 RepID=A0A8J3DWU9_9BACL|nr:DUF3267 domain-containing protein [Pullulanibacillus camelliae]GGE44453.1 putative membrane protein YhaJ [Pullulanibacillus camelliae]
MNCWKCFNVSKDIGTIKLAIFSLLGMVSFFIVFNLCFHYHQTSTEKPWTDGLILIICLLLIVPVHKLLHGVPIWITGQKAELAIKKINHLPMLYCNIKGLIPKSTAILSLGCPVVTLTVAMIVLTVLFPNQASEWALVGAVHFGLSVFDIFYLVHLITAPAHTYIEDDPYGCKILVKDTLNNEALH